MNTPTRVLVGPFNRVEGDLEIALDIDQGRVQAAYVNATLYRGFEQMMQGKHLNDALVIVPRVCGICSVSQSLAAAQALAQCYGITPTPNGQISHNLMAAAENIADHITHFYVFFMPDFARQHYASQPWYEEVAHRFKAEQGVSIRNLLAARQRWFELIGWLGGKWPHTLAIQPGGSTRAIESAERLRLLAIIDDFELFLQKNVLGMSCFEFSQISSMEALEAAWDKGFAQGALSRLPDLAVFWHMQKALRLGEMGRAYDVFLSAGAYPVADFSTGQKQDKVCLFQRGVWKNGMVWPFNPEGISEDPSHAWFYGDEALHPWQGQTNPLQNPDEQKPQAYTWCKAPRLMLDGEVNAVETGALARQMVDGHPLILDCYQKYGGGSVLARILARWLELARIMSELPAWVRQLQAGQPYCAQVPTNVEKNMRGVGLHEAARGTLGHWVQAESGRITRYQIIAPTTWNFSPRNRAGQAGALEHALVGLLADRGEDMPLQVQHVVRSFDPCMVCTVH